MHPSFSHCCYLQSSCMHLHFGFSSQRAFRFRSLLYVLLVSVSPAAHGPIRPPPNEKTPKITRRTPPCSLYALLIHPRSFPHSIDYPPPRDFQHHLLSLEPYPSKHKVKEQVILLQLFPFFRHSWRLVARPRGKVRKPQHLPLCMHC